MIFFCDICKPGGTDVLSENPAGTQEPKPTTSQTSIFREILCQTAESKNLVQLCAAMCNYVQLPPFIIYVSSCTARDPLIPRWRQPRLVVACHACQHLAQEIMDHCLASNTAFAVCPCCPKDHQGLPGAMGFAWPYMLGCWDVGAEIG